MSREGNFDQVMSATNRVVRSGALCYATLWVAVSLAVTFGVTSPSPGAISAAGLYVFGALWLLIAGWFYRDKSTSRSRLILGLAIYHIISAVYVLWIVGAASPVIYSWALLIITAGLYLGVRAGLASGAMLFTVLLTYYMLYPDLIDPVSLVTMVISFSVVALSAGLIGQIVMQTRRYQHDLDESHQLASLQRDRTMTLINNLTDAVISTDQNGIIMIYNAATLNLLDTNTDLEGKNIDDVLQLRDEDGAHLSLSDELYDARSANIRDDVVTLISGEATRLEVAYSPVRRTYDEDVDDDEIGGFIVIIRDVTAIKSLEEERDEFISVVSHELRTPIAIAEGTVSNAQIMLTRSDIPSHKIRDAIDMAHDQLVFLARIVNDLSTLSRAERGVADAAEDIDVNQLVRAIHREYQDEASAKGLAFDLHAEPKIGTVHASQLYLKELLQNFVTNAIKYTTSGSITLEANRVGDKVEFAVRDTGIGISRADQKRLFEKFYRAEDYRTRETNGTGLGLYVAAKLARKLDTEIVMKSRLNHGSRFSVSLPLIKAVKPKKKS